MFKPEYTITDSMLLDIIKIEQAKCVLSALDNSNESEKNLEIQSRTVNMFHLAHLLGVELTIKDAEKAVEGKKVETNDARGIILNNFRNCMDFVRSNVDGGFSDVDLNLLLHINKILLTDWKEPWEAKIRITHDEIDTSFDNWSQLKDNSIVGPAVEESVLDIINWYRDSNGKVHDLIRISMFVYNLMRIAPFQCCNQITIIAICDYLLYKTELSKKTYIPIVREFAQHESENIELWKQINNGENTVTVWLERFIQNIALGVNEDKSKILELNSKKANKQQTFLDLNRRQLKILRYLQTIPTVKREDYVQMMNISTMQAYRDLNDLVNKKLLRIEGRGRGTKYLLHNR